MSPLARRVERAARNLEPAWPDERARAVERGLHRRRRRRDRLRVASALALALAVAAGAWRFTHAPRAPRAPEFAAPAIELVRFADGSTAQPLDARSLVRAGAVEPGRVAAELERGGATFDVVRDPARRFRVHAGDVAVEVLGTRFTVERLAAHTRVTVERGRVRVEWPAGSSELGAGQSGLFPPDPPLADWRRLADDGDYDRAFRALARAGTKLRDDPAELLAAADVARLSHHPAEALAPLAHVADAWPDDPRAPLAAFTLGRVLLDELGRPREAAQAFAQARALAPSGALAGDALAREVESWSRAGDTARARERAIEYLREQPHGDRLGAVKRHGGIE
ncbi:MAG TPA: FecR family protein [Polyangia bacterium]|nr:FecR family protein [Polyangia bacterium]